MADREDPPGKAPGNTALLIIDMINPLAFQGGKDLRGPAEALIDPILRLRDAADREGVPVIYVNDNDGDWLSERSALIDRVAADDCLGRELARRLRPLDHHHFTIKPRFSGFYATNLPVLLPELGVTRLVLTGVATDICVLFTAADAHMREYDLWVPADATASEDAQRTRWAVEIMRSAMGADTRRTGQRGLGEWG